MTRAKLQGRWVIAVSFLVALVLTVMPLPEWAVPWRPAWPAMVLIYWCMALPERVSVGIGWVLGLFLDVLKGTLLGQHAAGFAVVAFITVKLHRRVRVFPLVKQSLFVGLVLALNALLTLWIRGIMGLPPKYINYWLPVLTSMLLWPWIFIILRDVRRKAHVS